MSWTSAFRSVNFNGRVNMGLICVLYCNVEQGQFAGRVFCFKGELAISVYEEAYYVCGALCVNVTDNYRRVWRSQCVDFVYDCEVFSEA